MFKISVLLMLTAAPVSAHAVELFANGGFDTGLNGYATSGGAIQQVLGQAYVNFAGGQGSQTATTNGFAAFGGGNVGGLNTLSQSILTVTGKTYNLTFAYGTFGQPGLSLDLFVGSDLSETFSSNGQFNLDTLFQPFTTSFVGTGSPVEIKFSVAGLTDDNQDVLLDNISVTAVPEAATWTLMIAGLAIVGVASRRRPAAAATSCSSI